MVENCYILYSCDGSYEPIVSNYGGLSAHTSEYVSITINSITANTCFYVLDIGNVECDVTYDVEIVSTDCDCECYCYFIKSVTETTDVTYVNCNSEIVVETITEGLTYNICSKVYPQFDVESQIPIKLTDICVNGQCPPSIPSIKPKNECDVITIFPMNVSCSIIQPSTDTSFDGATALIVTGGTPPYVIEWESGSFSPALSGLGVGEYNATVIDYYGDFTANTTCVLTAETTTFSGMCFVLTGISEENFVYVSTESLGLRNGKPYYQIQSGVNILGFVFWSQEDNQWVLCESLNCQTNNYSYLNSSSLYPSGSTGSWQSNTEEPTIIYESYIGTCIVPVPPVIPTDLCVTLSIKTGREGPPTTLNIDLEPSVEINGEPSWISSTGQYVIYWNTGSTPSQWTMTGYSDNSVLFTNNDPSYPPTSNWNVYGNPLITSMTVVEGNCESSYTINLNAIPNSSDCDSGGSITAQATGGVLPYQYSINGGTTYQFSPIFGNLTPGTYNLLVKDSNNITGSVSNIVVGNVPPTVYNITLSVNYLTNTFTITAPTMAPGVSVSLNVNLTSTFSYYPITLPTIPTYNNFATLSTIGPMTLVGAPVVNTYPLAGVCSPNTVTQIQTTYQNTIIMTSNQIITGSVTDTIINPPDGECANASGTYQVSIGDARCLNLECCDAKAINPPNRRIVIL